MKVRLVHCQKESIGLERLWISLQDSKVVFVVEVVCCYLLSGVYPARFGVPPVGKRALAV